MYLRELFLREDDRSTAVFAFGRFNPPTIGHEKLIQKVQSTASKVNGKAFIFLSHTGGTQKDPIDFTTKLSYLRQHFQSDPKLSFGDVRANTIIKVMKVLEQEGRTKVIMIAGDDRVMEFTKLLNQYNGKATKAGNVEYTFDSIQVISAGQRDPDASDITGVSASKAREFAMKGQEHEFSKIVMGGDNGKVLYDRIQDRFGKEVDENNKKLYNEAMEDAKPTVYLDMDGVLADFFGGIEKMYGVENWKQLTNDKTKDLKKEVIDRITGTDFFATLPKFPTADSLIDMVKKFTGGTFSINTSPLKGDHENSGKYKKVWISNNIEQPAEIVVTGRKETYAKDKASGTPNILIDDRPVNIQKWQAAGGYGILYQANRDSLTKVQKGLEEYGKVQRDQ
jgi:nicotinic acid mononucleotide adenylyltransferase|tara:strand:- start:1266 stop:2447 length:1182 start_codon:yes stop_codon:yes gene_type:complete